MKNHPNFLTNAPESKEIMPRGGDIPSTVVLAKLILQFLADHGLTAGLVSGITVLIGNIPLNAVSTVLRDSSPQNLPQLNKETELNIVHDDKIYLDHCNQNLKYLLTILEDKNIPFPEKIKRTYQILTNYLNPRSSGGRQNLAICISYIIYILFNKQRSGYYAMMRNLIEAVREGKIRKSLVRLICKLLRKQGVPIDPELDDLLDFDPKP